MNITTLLPVLPKLPLPRPRKPEPPAGAAALARDHLKLSYVLPSPGLLEKTLETGKALRFANGLGGSSTVNVYRRGEGNLLMVLDGKPLRIKLDAGIPVGWVLSHVAYYLSQLPPPMRQGLASIEVTHRVKPGVAATTYNGHNVVFWNGMVNLRPSHFFHEMGHVNAWRVYGHGDPSDAWDRAQASDGKRITEYANKNDNEDFAETFEAYWLARRGEGQYTLDSLRAAFPARLAIIEAIVAGEPVELRDADHMGARAIARPVWQSAWQKLWKGE